MRFNKWYDFLVIKVVTARIFHITTKARCRACATGFGLFSIRLKTFYQGES